MHILPYQSLTKFQKESFFDFLKKASNETDQPAHENMWSDDWENKNNTLMYLLEKTERFSMGGTYNVLFDGDNVVACSGIYTSAFSSELAIAGSRIWVDKDYRNLSIAREYLLPKEKKWAIENNFKAIGLCFNDYNKNVINTWKRKRLGEHRKPRQPHHIFYDNMHEVAFPINIQFTKQWLIYEILQSDFMYDWNSIKWND